VAVLKLGFLDPSEETEHLKANRALELPLWIVQELAEKVVRQWLAPPSLSLLATTTTTRREERRTEGRRI
jgi:hypothetical protein